MPPIVSIRNKIASAGIKSAEQIRAAAVRATARSGRIQYTYEEPQEDVLLMQETVSAHMEQLKSLSQSEESRREALAQTYAKTKEIEKLKSAFFSSMTHQLADEVAQIQGGADKLYESGGDIDNEEMTQVMKDIERDGVRVTEILNDMLSSNN